MGYTYLVTKIISISFGVLRRIIALPPGITCFLSYYKRIVFMFMQISEKAPLCTQVFGIQIIRVKEEKRDTYKVY